MRVLSIHNHYQQAGGEDESTALEVSLLRSHGHEVIEYRESNDRIASMSPLRAAARTVWSLESYRAIRDTVRSARPDLVHIQNFFPLISPSAHYAARREGVPVIQSLRNFRLVCSNGLFLRDGRVCEDCLGRSVPLPGVVHACYRGSRAASTAVAGMLITHRAARTWSRVVDRYIALTDFVRCKMVEAGLPADRISVKPNFVSPDPGMGRSGEGSYALFIGRLSPEKGLMPLLEAWREIPDLPLRIAGSGPMEEVARAFILHHGLSGRVELLGRQTQDQISELLSDTRVLVLPSVWYETFGRVAVEAFAAGVPVIASRLGAMAEIVEDGVSGLHFAPGDPAELASRVRWALDNPVEWREFGVRARATYEAKYTAERNYQLLMDIYGEVLRGAPAAA